MSLYQKSFDAYLALKAQSGLGAIASGSGAAILPITGGKGQLQKAAIQSQAVSRDGLPIRGRHGLQKFTASYGGELQLSNFDAILGGLMRGSFASGASITQATGAMSSATMSATGSTITFSGGSVITAGLRVGDVVTFTVGLAAGDLNRPLRIAGLTATTITTAETLTTVTGPVSTYAFSVKGRKLINPLAGSLVDAYFTAEECEVGADNSVVAQDVRVGSFQLAMQPNGMLNTTVGFTGTGNVQGLSGASAPYFSSPTTTTATPLSVIDATIRVGSSDVLDLTAFSMGFDLGLQAPDVVGAKYSPDVIDNVLTSNISFTALKKDLTYFGNYLNETTLSLSVLAQVPGTSPTDFISIYIPNFTLGGVDFSELKKDSGARTQSITVPKELIGRDDRGGAYEPTLAKFQVSN